MERSRLVLFVLLALGFVFATTQNAEASRVPRLVTYQGLIPGGGNAKVKIMINFYKTIDGDGSTFSEFHESVQLTQGVFSILLGSQTTGGLPSGIFVNSEAIGISINGGAELVPRMLLTMVPFADRATGSETLVGANTTTVVMKTLNANTVQIVDSSDNVQFEFHADALNNAGEFNMFNETGTETVEILGGGGFDGSGSVLLRRADGSVATIMSANANLVGTSMLMSSPAGKLLVSMKGAPSGGVLGLSDADGTRKITLNAGDGEGSLIVGDPSGSAKVELRARAIGGGEAIFRSPSNDRGVVINAFSTGGQIVMRGEGENRILLIADNGGRDAEIWLRSNGRRTIRLSSNDLNGDGRITTDVLEIVGGSDLSEQFDIVSAIAPKPGMVVSIDPLHPGKLTVSHTPYDRKVAGIISGAGGVKPGMIMGQRGTIADGKYAVALTGRVWCHVDASLGAIVPGDLLTTSDTPGHAMKVTDYPNAQGAIIGKAMTALDAGKGLVLVLVSLQ